MLCTSNRCENSQSVPALVRDLELPEKSRRLTLKPSSFVRSPALLAIVQIPCWQYGAYFCFAILYLLHPRCIIIDRFLMPSAYKMRSDSECAKFFSAQLFKISSMLKRRVEVHLPPWWMSFQGSCCFGLYNLAYWLWGGIVSDLRRLIIYFRASVQFLSRIYLRFKVGRLKVKEWN